MMVKTNLVHLCGNLRKSENDVFALVQEYLNKNKSKKLLLEMASLVTDDDKFCLSVGIFTLVLRTKLKHVDVSVALSSYFISRPRIL